MRHNLVIGSCKLWLLPLFILHLVQVDELNSSATWSDGACAYASALHRDFTMDKSSTAELLPPDITPAGPFCANEGDELLTANPPGGTWSGPGIVNPTTGLFSPATAGPGTHTITYTDPGGSSTTAMITVWSAPVISFIAGDGTDCNGGSDGNTIITVTGGTQFAGPLGCKYLFDWDWDGSPGNDSYPSGCTDGIDLEDLNNLPAGVYTVTVTDANGCTATGVADVDEPPAIVATADDVELPCFGTTGEIIDLMVSGGTPGYDYDWDYDGTGDNDDPQDPTITGPGLYSVTITDFLGCTAEVAVQVTEPEELDASATSDPALCAGESTGSIDLTVTGGTPGYTYDWDYDGTGDNDDPQDPTDLPGGTYSVTVTDANGCTATATVDVDEPLLEVTASATGTEVTCFGADNGSIDLTPGGGTGSYTYDWDNDGVGDNNDPQDLDNLPPGSYSVTVTDANGCTAVASVTIAEPAEITGTHTEMICAGGSVVINGTTYDESNPSGTEVFTAANGCDSTVTVTITFAPPLTGEETYEGCEGDGYSVTIGGITYDESNPSGTVTISNADGCDSIVTVNLTFQGPVYGEETYEGCEGDGYFVVVGGITFNEAMPSGTVPLVSSMGCDSIVNVSLTFNSETTSTITNQGCQGGNYSIIVNGTTYDENNPSGVETITNAAGCDSIITIDLFFGAPSSSEVTNTSCSGSGYEVVVNGTTYNEAMPSGTETMTNAVGCDSVITIALTFLPPTTGEETYLGCEGDGYEVVVNGTPYNEGNPTGTETLVGSNGCDSVVTINLTFQGTVYGSETYTGCTGDGYSVEVGGITFDESYPSGQVELTSQAGCDSIVTVALTFHNPTASEINYDGCDGDGYEIIVNGTIYNQSNPSGTETITNALGCDSVITINLAFGLNSTGEETYQGCQGDGYEVIVNGVEYNEQNPTGTEELTNAAGCDSIVTIALIFAPPYNEVITHDGCIGDGFSVTVNGTVYDEDNPQGVEEMTGVNGCDSIITIDLEFTAEITTNLNPLLCDGDFIIVNGTQYDQDNPTGTEQFVAQGGCDSIVIIDLDFLPPLTGEFFADVCEGGFIVVNGTTYDESNPSGEETFTSVNGCDSIVTVQITFLPALEGTETYTGCVGDGYFVVVNNTLYNEANPSGTEWLTTAQGCDSLVTIDLTFSNSGSSTISYEGCEGDGYEVIVNGTVYDEDHPTGEEEFENGAGCDSVVYIQLSFAPAATSTITYQGCFGDGYEVVVNGTVYNESNPEGVEEMQTAQGCDSIVTISLSFSDGIETFLTPEVCTGGSIEINGEIFDEQNPSGSFTFVAIGGCDSIVYVDLQFLPVPEGQESYVGCSGDGYTVVVNGTVYDENNPTGTETFQTAAGCDTIVHIDLVFDQTINILVDTTLCANDSIVINGTTYDASNPSGTEVIAGQGTCDTLIDVNLTFLAADTSLVTYTGCQGDGYAVSINGTSYNESNPAGAEVLTGSDGCDSVVVVSLTFQNCCLPDTVSLARTICAGDTYAWQGMNLTEPGMYTDVVPDAVGPGCDSVYMLDLAVADAILNSITAEICQGETYVFAGQPYIMPGIYRDTIFGGASFGCDSIIELILEVTPNPMANAGDDQLITCGMQQVALNAIVSGGTPNWTGPDITPLNANQVSPIVGKPGLYTLTVTHPAGCTDTDEVMVNADESTPIADAGPDGSLTCKEPTFVLSPNLIGQNLAWEWEGPSITTGNATELNPVVDLAGVYIFHLIDTVSLCEADPDTLIVTDLQAQLTALVAAPDVITCASPSVILDGSGSSTGANIDYQWQDASGNLLGDGILLETSDAGNYLFLVVDAMTGCRDSASVEVERSGDFPIVDVAESQLIDCRNSTALVEAWLGQPAVDLAIMWTGPQGGIIGDPTQLQITTGAEGWYHVSVENITNGCVSRDSVWVEVDIDAPPAVAVIENHISCHEASALAWADPGNSTHELVFIWYTATGEMVDTAAVIEMWEAGAYMLETIDLDNGCTSWDTLIILATEAPEAIVETTDERCKDDGQGSVMIADVTGGLPPYTFMLNGGQAQSTPFYDGVAPGSYTVQVMDAAGCQWEQVVEIGAGLDLTLDIGLDLVLQPGETAQLQGTVNVPWAMIDSIFWTPQEILSCSSCPNPILNAVYSTTILAEVWSEGCSAEDALTLRVDTEYDVYIPNVFTPNFDGVNDYFTVYGGRSVRSIQQLEVFDRWGNKVFAEDGLTPNQPAEGWNGTFREQALNPGVYVFRAAVEFTDGVVKSFSGDVTLLR